MKPRTNTRDHPIGPHTLGGDLLDGDIINVEPFDALLKVATIVGDERYGIRRDGEKLMRIFPDDKYVLVEKAKEGS